ncbi:hypothetical protein [Methanolobus vulcani]|uniref:hypothetical protein n=1 Tax=Methanolobus vulcani TaxID=38026 RepID=UPI0012B86F75|nr:hypothetical protein [Methanolobus vulcani]
MQDKMTSKERFINALELKEVDRVPLNTPLEKMAILWKSMHHILKGVIKCMELH